MQKKKARRWFCRMTRIGNEGHDGLEAINFILLDAAEKPLLPEALGGEPQFEHVRQWKDGRDGDSPEYQIWLEKSPRRFIKTVLRIRVHIQDAAIQTDTPASYMVVRAQNGEYELWLHKCDVYAQKGVDFTHIGRMVLEVHQVHQGPHATA